MTARQALSTVLVDANVLFASGPRSILIELAMVNIIAICWSPTILDEMVHALLRAPTGYTSEKARRLVAAMTGALPEAMIIPPKPTLPLPTLPDPQDVHVLLAAAHGRCNAILTFNLTDFPPVELFRHYP